MQIIVAVERIRKALRMVEHGGKYGRANGIYTAGKRWVFEDNLELTLMALVANWHYIDWTKPQITETIIGSELYKSWDIEVRKAVGRCISLFVANDWLPIQLKCANPGVSGKRIYVTADTVLPTPSIKRIRIVYRDAAQLKQLMTHKKVSSVSARDIRIPPALLLPGRLNQKQTIPIA